MGSALRDDDVIFDLARISPTGSTAPPGHCFGQGVKIAGIFLLYIILVHNARFMNHE